MHAWRVEGVRDLESLQHLKGDEMSSGEGEKHDSFLVWLEPEARFKWKWADTTPNVSNREYGFLLVTSVVCFASVEGLGETV